MSKKIIIVFGDPNSINSEIIFKSWKKLSFIIKRKIYLISNFELLKKQFKILKYPIIHERIQKLLNEDDFRDEFSHTILHNQNVFDEFRAA